MNNGDSWDESRKFVLTELDRLGDCTAENTRAIGVLTTRVAVIWLKVTIWGAIAGIGGGAGTLIGKLLFDLAKK